MNIKSQAMLVSIILLLLGAAWLVQEGQLWGRAANYTVPWFCAALAIALMILLIVCNVRGQAPADLPWLVVTATVLATAVVLIAGIEVDAETYPSQHIEAARWEVAGFVGLLLGLLLVARRYRRS